jgi:uncharacterized membrane protein
MTAYFAVKLVHILATAVWFGGGLFLPGDIRRTLALGRPHADALVPRIKRVVPFLIGGGNLTLLSGLALVFIAGGFAAVPPRILVGLGLTVLLLGLGASVVAPTWNRIAHLVESGGDLAEAGRIARRFSVLNHVEHALWLAVLALMVLRF